MQTHRPSRLIAALALAGACLAFPIATPVVQAQTQTAPLAAPTPADPISAAITEASGRFGVPETWIRSVMRVESAGNPVAVSHAGAMGLMQVMPGTYAELRSRYGLGADPFAVRDNILAGTAYLREMFDRYGSPGFLGAYNAGPGRWEEHLTGARPLPGETVAYLARLGPAIGVAPLVVSPNTALSAPSPRPPSPFASPIFVALQTAPTMEETPPEGIDIRQVIAANVTRTRSQGGMFVGRGGVDALPASTPPNDRATADTARSQIQRAPTDERPPPVQNSLFVPRSNLADFR